MGVFRLGLLMVLVVFVILPVVIAEESATELNVLNSQPIFEGTIPDFSWEGTPLLNAFNMNDYFYDLQDDVMNFSYTGAVNLTITIDEYGNVSFYPDSGFIGEEDITFHAEDEIGIVSSNVVNLGIGVDLDPPQWSNPVTSKIDIYQNDYIGFNVSWTDNFNLKSYSTSIKQGGVWKDYDDTFSGKAAVSSSVVQISSAFGESIFWKVCAYDTANNVACTDEYEIVVLKRPVSDGSGPVGSSGSGDYGGSESGNSLDSSYGGVVSEKLKGLLDLAKDFLGTEAKEDFAVSIDSFLVTLKQGTSKSQVFEISNTGTEDLNLTLSIQGLEDLTVLSNREIFLKKGESRVITIDFKVDLKTPVGEYFGYLVVGSSKNVLIPLVINVNNVDLDFEVIIKVLNESKSVKPGKKVLANITINNLGDKVLTDVNFYYAIKDFEGSIYESKDENFSIGASISFLKNLSVGASMPVGKYVFYGRVFNYKDVAINSDTFVVGESFKFEAFIKASSIFLVIISLSILSLILISKRNRQKEREKVLNLYVRLNELKEYVKEGQFDRAASSYIAIKAFYGERVSGDILENKEKLMKEIKRLSSKIDFEEEPASEEKDGENSEKLDDEAGSDDKEKSEEDSKKEVEKKEGTDKPEDKDKDDKEEKKNVEPKEEKVEDKSVTEEKKEEVDKVEDKEEKNVDEKEKKGDKEPEEKKEDNKEKEKKEGTDKPEDKDKKDGEENKEDGKKEEDESKSPDTVDSKSEDDKKEVKREGKNVEEKGDKEEPEVKDNKEDLKPEEKKGDKEPEEKKADEKEDGKSDDNKEDSKQEEKKEDNDNKVKEKPEDKGKSILDNINSEIKKLDDKKEGPEEKKADEKEDGKSDDNKEDPKQEEKKEVKKDEK